MVKRQSFFKQFAAASIGVLALTCSAFAVEKSPSPAQTVSVEQASLEIGSLLQVLNARLELMDEVAKWKWNNTAPIENLAREEKLVREFSQKSEEEGLNPKVAKQVFEAQLDAGKTLQIHDFEKWAKQDLHKHATPAQKHEDLLAQLDAINAQIIDKLKVVTPLLKTSSYDAVIKAQAEQIIKDPEAREIAIQPLLGLSQQN